MTPRDGRTGAAPEVELARIDSDVHHLRDQNDTDRRSTATRFSELRRELEGIHVAQATQASQLARVTDLADRVDVSCTSQRKMLEAITIELAERRGGIKLVGALAIFMPIVVAIAEHLFR